MAKFEEDFNKIISEIKPTGAIKKRQDKDILIEILETSRSMDRRVRMLESGNIHTANLIDKTDFKRPLNNKVSSGMRDSVFSMVTDEKYSTDDIFTFIANYQRVSAKDAIGIFKQIMNEQKIFKDKNTL